MQRRKFSREFKLEAIRLVRDRGVSVAQAARGLDVHENVLRKWVRDHHDDDPGWAFPGHGVMRPEQQELERLRRENAKLKAERDILKKSGRLLREELDMRFWDNAAMESFFSSLKTERIARKTYRTRDQARAEVFDYIERFYNPTRRHSTIGYLSPMDFERQTIVA